MDIDRARTFLAIVHTGSFLRAAERLHVTPTPVSARIRTLEEELGRTLCLTNPTRARLPPRGAEFERLARLFVRVWEQARQQLAMPAGKSDIIRIAAELSLWDPFLVDWMERIRADRLALAVRAHVAPPE